MKIKRAYQIPNKITMGIFKLPCVMGISKTFDPVSFEYMIINRIPPKEGEFMKLSSCHIGDWLCELEDNSWLVLTDEEYKAI